MKITLADKIRQVRNLLAEKTRVCWNYGDCVNSFCLASAIAKVEGIEPILEDSRTSMRNFDELCETETYRAINEEVFSICSFNNSTDDDEKVLAKLDEIAEKYSRRDTMVALVH